MILICVFEEQLPLTTITIVISAKHTFDCIGAEIAAKQSLLFEILDCSAAYFP